MMDSGEWSYGGGFGGGASRPGTPYREDMMELGFSLRQASERVASGQLGPWSGSACCS